MNDNKWIALGNSAAIRPLALLMPVRLKFAGGKNGGWNALSDNCYPADYRYDVYSLDTQELIAEAVAPVSRLVAGKVNSACYGTGYWSTDGFKLFSANETMMISGEE